jgi:hypothetical protein
MIREVCSCGAEFETDDRDSVSLVKNWRRTHKHAEKQPTQETKDSVVLSNTDIALGFQAIYNPMEEEE